MILVRSGNHSLQAKSQTLRLPKVLLVENGGDGLFWMVKNCGAVRVCWHSQDPVTYETSHTIQCSFHP